MSLVIAAEPRVVDGLPGLEIQQVQRLGVGKVDQVYFQYIPPGGIKLSEHLLAKARTAGDLQTAKDQRFKTRNEEQCLGVLIHTYAHVLASSFVEKANAPFEYRRKLQCNWYHLGLRHLKHLAQLGL